MIGRGYHMQTQSLIRFRRNHNEQCSESHPGLHAPLTPARARPILYHEPIGMTRQKIRLTASRKAASARALRDFGMESGRGEV